MVSGQLPLNNISGLNGLGRLRFARPSYAMTASGLVSSQADEAMRSDVARAVSGVDGTGVVVGTLSDSFNCQGGAAGDVATGDLPPGIVVLDDEDGCGSGSDEGRAMMQLIHDVVPGAGQAFHSAFNGESDFAAGIVELAAIGGADVIVDDVIYFLEPMFQDGVVAQAVDTVEGMGVSYFSAAGNNARDSYESPFRSSGISLVFAGADAHDFNPGSGVDLFQRITVPPGSSFILVMQWDEPYASVSGAPGSASDVDVFLTDNPPSHVITGSIDGNFGGDPAEIFFFSNPSTSSVSTFNIVIEKFFGPSPGLMKYILFTRGPAVTIDQGNTSSGTVYGHADAAGAEAVGAAFYGFTPEFGVTPPILEWFSSAGTTPILFDTDGTRRPSPEARQKPGIVAPDGTNTTFFGSDIGFDPDPFPNFFGTSAAAPQAAAVAALMLEMDPTLTHDAVVDALRTTAIDMDLPGVDSDTGYGLIQANLAVEAVTPNQASESHDDSSGTPEDTPVIIDVLDNDLDTDGDLDPATVTVTQNPSNGDTSVNPVTGTITYTPDDDFNGADTFGYTVADDEGETSDEATVTIQVQAVNDPPEADPQTVPANEDNPVGITLTGSDIDGDDLNFDVVSGPSNGALSGTAPDLTYTPADDFNGQDSFTFTVSDPSGATSDEATVTINVQGANDPPEADPQTVPANEDNPVGITLTGSDIDGDDLNFDVVSGPSNGALSGTAPDLTYTPADDFNGQDSFTFTVSDPSGATSDEATVTINVQGANDPPTVDQVPPIVLDEGFDVVLDLDDLVEDLETADGQIQWSGLALDDSIADVTVDSVTRKATISGMSGSGPATIRLTATDRGDPDGCVGTAPECDSPIEVSVDISVTVNEVGPTVAAGGPYSGGEGSSIVFDGSAQGPGSTGAVYQWDFDYDGDAFDVQASGVDLTGPSHAYPDDGEFTVALRLVYGDDQVSGVSSADVTVSNIAPTASAGGPYGGTSGSPIVFTGSATDPGDDTLTYNWDFDYDGQTFVTDDSGVDLTGPGHTYSAAGDYVVALMVSEEDGGDSDIATALVTVAPTNVSAVVDIRPSSINLNSGGVTPVAVLANETFDANGVDIGTLRFGVNGTEGMAAHGGHIEDLNGDGLDDLMLHIPTEDLGIPLITSDGTFLPLLLTGSLLSGAEISGQDVALIRVKRLARPRTPEVGPPPTGVQTLAPTPEAPATGSLDPTIVDSPPIDGATEPIADGVPEEGTAVASDPDGAGDPETQDTGSGDENDNNDDGDDDSGDDQNRGQGQGQGRANGKDDAPGSNKDKSDEGGDAGSQDTEDSSTVADGTVSQDSNDSEGQTGSGEGGGENTDPEGGEDESGAAAQGQDQEGDEGKGQSGSGSIEGNDGDGQSGSGSSEGDDGNGQGGSGSSEGDDANSNESPTEDGVGDGEPEPGETETNEGDSTGTGGSGEESGDSDPGEASPGDEDGNSGGNESDNGNGGGNGGGGGNGNGNGGGGNGGGNQGK